MNIIDSDNYEASGIETMFFPGGEPHCKVNKKVPHGTILFLKLRTWNDAGIAACVLDVLEPTSLKVFIPYWPGMRQDKPVRGTPKTLSLVENLLYSSGGHHQLFTFDPHSVIAKAYIGGTTFMPEDLNIDIKDDVVGIIAPDAGATERATSFRDTFYPEATLVQCDKTRDPDTGRLYAYHMPELKEPGRYIIVDDICDGGGTFNLLADVWKRQEPEGKHLELWVSHGIFSKGIYNIDLIIETIYTTDSWYINDLTRPDTRRVVCYPLFQLFERISNV